MINSYVQFAIPRNEVEYTDFMLPFELLNRDTKSEELLDTATSFYAKIKS